MKEQPLINIITRTSNRPNYFKNCVDSVRSQNYKNINHIISVDNKKTEKYVTEMYPDLKYIKCDFTPKQHREHAPYNLYLNDLLNEIKDGWVIVLDDDDKFINNDALTIIANHMQSNDSLLFWKVQFPHTTIPENHYFNKKPVVCHIDTMCFAFHISQLNGVKFDNTQIGDFNFISDLYDLIPNKIWIDDIFIALQRNDMGGRGMQDDLETIN